MKIILSQTRNERFEVFTESRDIGIPNYCIRDLLSCVTLIHDTRQYILNHYLLAICEYSEEHGDW